MLRHPKLCRFFIQYKNCKFDPCRFEHVEKETDIEKLILENQKIQEKLTYFETTLNEKEHSENEVKNCEEKMIQLEEKIKNLEKEETNVLNKRNILQRIEDLEKNNIEKDEKIRFLTGKIEELEPEQRKNRLLNEKIEGVETLMKKMTFSMITLSPPC